MKYPSAKAHVEDKGGDHSLANIKSIVIYLLQYIYNKYTINTLVFVTLIQFIHAAAFSLIIFRFCKRRPPLTSIGPEKFFRLKFSCHTKEKTMGIFKLSKMTLIAQPGDGTCWCASAIMLYKWGRKTGSHRMVDPLSDAGIKRRWEENGDWDSSDNAWLATTLNTETHSDIPLDRDGLKSFLQEHGPIWCAGLKTWSGSAFGHVVVIGGVADTGVFIYDPQPEGYGSSRWLTWTQIADFISKGEASVPFMTVK